MPECAARLCLPDDAAVRSVQDRTTVAHGPAVLCVRKGHAANVGPSQRVAPSRWSRRPRCAHCLVIARSQPCSASGKATPSRSRRAPLVWLAHAYRRSRSAGLCHHGPRATLGCRRQRPTPRRGRRSLRTAPSRDPPIRSVHDHIWIARPRSTISRRTTHRPAVLLIREGHAVEVLKVPHHSSMNSRKPPAPPGSPPSAV